MSFIDPHIHMVSRSPDDYRLMAAAGCTAVSEPAFWAGFDRGGVAGFRDYFRQLTEVEPRRAAGFGIAHHAWLCINPKEAECPELAREVIAILPEFLEAPNVLGIGEIGLNRNTRSELASFEAQLDLAAARGLMVLVHTPHLEDKRKGTRLILDAIAADGRLDPGRVLIDHVEEHTIAEVLDRGHWAGMTLYAPTKCTPARAADMLECYGAERLLVNSACDWGGSRPLAVPETRQELIRRGHDRALAHRVVYENPAAFLGQSPRFRATG